MIEILSRLCRVCDACVAVCPTLALWTSHDRLSWRAEACRDERACVAVCPAGALRHLPAATGQGLSTEPGAPPA